MKLKTNQKYTYKTIAYLLSEYEEHECGEYAIGEQFLIFRNSKNSSVVSFVLTGIKGSNDIYKCVYKELNIKKGEEGGTH